MSIQKYFEILDKAIDGEVANNPIKPCCSKGCSTCCSEAVMAEKQEAIYIVEAYPPERLDELKAKVAAWMEQFKPFQYADTQNGLIDGFKYLESDIKCPLLNGKLCGVYDRRPMGCRSYLATGNPEHCKPEHRRTQLIAMPPAFSNPAMLECFQELHAVTTTFHMDHLGVHLYNILFGTDITTSVTEIYQTQ